VAVWILERDGVAFREAMAPIIEDRDNMLRSGWGVTEGMERLDAPVTRLAFTQMGEHHG
jgi:hypothetical protein